jgi:hypothetical protein
MAVTTEKSADATALRPFRIEIPEEAPGAFADAILKGGRAK